MIKSLLKPIYKRSVVLPRVMSLIRRPRYRRMARLDAPPFNGDRRMAQVVEFLIQCGVSSFVETGTYLGHTCRHIASSHPQLSVSTIESNPDYFYASQTVLRHYTNVHAISGDSAVEIDRLVKNRNSGIILFFLDAHWYDYLPLPDEIRSISSNLSEAILVIHDFQVPGRKDFKFDTCNGRTIGMEMLRESLVEGRLIHIFLPNYTYADAYGVPAPNGKQLCGYAIVFLGMLEVVNFLAESKYGRWYTSCRLS
jgi:hypothetical protein